VRGISTKTEKRLTGDWRSSWFRGQRYRWFTIQRALSFRLAVAIPLTRAPCQH
jgi:hypothetical protein